MTLFTKQSVLCSSSLNHKPALVAVVCGDNSSSDTARNVEILNLRGQVVGAFQAESSILDITWSGHNVFPEYQSGLIAVLQSNNAISIWNPASILANEPKDPLSSFDTGSTIVQKIAFNPHNCHLAVMSATDVVVYDLSTSIKTPESFTLSTTTKASSAQYTSLAWNPKISTVLATSTSEGNAIIFDTGKHRREIYNVYSQDENSKIPSSSSVSWNSESSTLLAITSDSPALPVVQVWDLRDPKQPVMSFEHTSPVLAVNWCVADPGYIITSSQDNVCRMFSTHTKSFLGYLPTTLHSIKSIEWTQQNPQFISIRGQSPDSNVSSLSMISIHDIAHALVDETQKNTQAIVELVSEHPPNWMMQRVSIEQTVRGKKIVTPSSGWSVVSGGYGGHLVHSYADTYNATQSVSVVTTKHLTPPTESPVDPELVAALNTENLEEYLDRRADEATEETKVMLKAIKTLNSPNRTKELLHLIGFDMSDVRTDAEEEAFERAEEIRKREEKQRETEAKQRELQEQEQKRKEEEERQRAQKEMEEEMHNDDDEFFSTIAETTTEDSNEKEAPVSKQVEEEAPEEDKFWFSPSQQAVDRFNALSAADKERETAIEAKITVGDLKGAAELCLEKNPAEALVIASYASERVQRKILERVKETLGQSVSFIGLLQRVTEMKIGTVEWKEGCTRKEGSHLGWKKDAAIALTYLTPVEAQKTLGEMAERLERNPDATIKSSTDAVDKMAVPLLYLIAGRIGDAYRQWEVCEPTATLDACRQFRVQLERHLLLIQGSPAVAVSKDSIDLFIKCAFQLVSSGQAQESVSFIDGVLKSIRLTMGSQVRSEHPLSLLLTVRRLLEASFCLDDPAKIDAIVRAFNVHAPPSPKQGSRSAAVVQSKRPATQIPSKTTQPPRQVPQQPLPSNIDRPPHLPNKTHIPPIPSQPPQDNTLRSPHSSLPPPTQPPTILQTPIQQTPPTIKFPSGPKAPRANISIPLEPQEVHMKRIKGNPEPSHQYQQQHVQQIQPQHIQQQHIQQQHIQQHIQPQGMQQPMQFNTPQQQPQSFVQTPQQQSAVSTPQVTSGVPSEKVMEMVNKLDAMIEGSQHQNQQTKQACKTFASMIRQLVPHPQVDQPTFGLIKDFCSKTLTLTKQIANSSALSPDFVALIVDMASKCEQRDYEGALQSHRQIVVKFWDVAQGYAPQLKRMIEDMKKL
ncbi:putative Protein transport protein SEC31 [Blattamonas nauphoetae]|uniref:Protein transport protein SEC31 n=1 Tax=Blattamonas nauphoetae TaxID=2049346 RepID=A0ABQ9YFL1_9EUKA|nr:putative Protein transport protein SEC31 [Blattamonas nauphoetae]